MGIYIKRVDQVITKMTKPTNVNIFTSTGIPNTTYVVSDPHNLWRWDVGIGGDFSCLQMLCIYVENSYNMPKFILNSIPKMLYTADVVWKPSSIDTLRNPLMLPIDFKYKASNGERELLLELFADFKSVSNRPYPVWVENVSGNEYYIDGDYDRICDGLYEVDLEPTLMNFSRSL